MYLDSVWWFRVTLEGAVFLIGVPGNILIIHVYASKRPKVTPHVFIIGLGVADLSVCFLRIITLPQFFPPLDTLAASNEFFCRVSPVIDNWPRYTSILLTSAIAVDRYLAICRPHGRRMTVRRARHVVYACLAASMVFMLPYVFIYGIKPLNGTTACGFVAPPEAITAQFLILMIFFLVSLVVIVVLYAKIYRTVKRMAKVRPGNAVHRGASQRPSRIHVSQDNSTARAEGITPNQLLAMVSRKPSPGSQQGKSADELAPEPEAGTSVGPLKTKLAWGSGHQLMKEAPILNLPTKRIVSVSTGDNITTLASPSLQSTDEAPAREAESDQPTAPQFHKKTTLMLLLSTIIFVVTLLPLCIVLVVYPLIIPLLRNASFRFLINVASHVNLVNHAANPFLFSFVNRRFREDMKRSLRKLCRRNCRFRD